MRKNNMKETKENFIKGHKRRSESSYIMFLDGKNQYFKDVSFHQNDLRS